MGGVLLELVIKRLGKTKVGEGHCQIHSGPSWSYGNLPYLLVQFGIGNAQVHEICHQLPND